MGPHGSSEPPRADPAGHGASTPVSTTTILVVDDDSAALDLMGAVLRRAGAEVTAAASGRAALRAVAEGRCRPTLLVTNIEMPGMSGIELSARVRALRPAIQVVMITSDAESADAARDRPDLVMRVLLKPVTVGDLLEAAGCSPLSRGDDDLRR